MVLSDISIRRPVLAIVINLVSLLVGIICYQRLPVRLIPNVDVPVVTVDDRLSRRQRAGDRVADHQADRGCAVGHRGHRLHPVGQPRRVQPGHGRASASTAIPTRAASDVRDRVAQARGALPEEADEPIVQKQEADAQPIIYLAFSSDRHSLIEIADFADRLVKDRVQTIPGVAQAQVYGNRYAMRVWLRPGAAGRRRR